MQHFAQPGLSDKQLKNYLQLSYRLVSRSIKKEKE
jgi:hypothetical protein